MSTLAWRFRKGDRNWSREVRMFPCDDGVAVGRNGVVPEAKLTGKEIIK